MIDNLLLGFSVAFSVHNLMYAFIGVFIGNLIGVLPGIGAMAAISMLLPVTYTLDSTGAILMLAGLYYGTGFGGATTSILLGIPGTAQHAVVCLDGHPLARLGKAGPAIFMAMFASFVGVCVGIVVMTWFSPLLVEAAFQFGPAEYFSLMVMGLLAASTLSAGSPLRAVAAVVVGLLLGAVGTDVNTGVWRFTFDIPELADGIPLVALALALFGFCDVLQTAGRPAVRAPLRQSVGRKSVRPGKEDIRSSGGAIARGSVIGSFLGALPGTGGTLASFMSYAIEKKIAKDPSRFGRGAIEGVSGPEAANSSAEITAFIPTLTLGIPGDAVMALMLGALMIHDVTPGPQIMVRHPELFWGLIVSFWLGNIMLLVLNIPLISIWVRMLTVPYRIIYPVVVFLVCIASYSESNNLFDVQVVILLAIFGFVLAKQKIPPAPLLLGFILGPMMEENFRRALLISRGDISTLVTRPISGSFLLVTLLIVLLVSYRQYVRRRVQA